MTTIGFSDEAFKELFLRVLRLSESVYRDELKIGDVEQWDSIAHLELVSELELAFGVQFATEDLMGIKTAGALRSRVAELRG